MNAIGIDHLSLRIPADSVDQFVTLYGDTLGLELEQLDAYRNAEQQFFSVRLTEESVLQVLPTNDLPNRDVDRFDHFAVRVDDSLPALLNQLEASSAIIKTVITDRYGATGPSPSVYVEDPLGYTVEFRPSSTDS